MCKILILSLSLLTLFCALCHCLPTTDYTDGMEPRKLFEYDEHIEFLGADDDEKDSWYNGIVTEKRQKPIHDGVENEVLKHEDEVHWTDTFLKALLAPIAEEQKTVENEENHDSNMQKLDDISKAVESLSNLDKVLDEIETIILKQEQEQQQDKQLSDDERKEEAVVINDATMNKEVNPNNVWFFLNNPNFMLEQHNRFDTKGIVEKEVHHPYFLNSPPEPSNDIHISVNDVDIQISPKSHNHG